MVEPIPSTHPKINEWMTAVLTSVPPEVLEQYRSRTCVSGDMSYKLKQLLSAMTNDWPHSEAVSRAQRVIRQCLFIREALEIDSILNDAYFPSELIPMLEKFSCLSVVGTDNKGNTAIYFNLTRFTASDYARCWQLGERAVPAAVLAGEYPEFKEACVVNYCALWYVRMMEWIHRHRFESFKRGQAAEPRVIMILNVGSLGPTIWSSELRQFLKGIKTLGNVLYPEIADYIFAGNVPWIADRFWPVIKRVLHPATAVKVDLYDHHRTKRFIKDLMNQDQLPKCFGGTYHPERKFKAAGPSIDEENSPSETLTTYSMTDPSSYESGEAGEFFETISSEESNVAQ